MFFRVKSKLQPIDNLKNKIIPLFKKKLLVRMKLILTLVYEFILYLYFFYIEENFLFTLEPCLK